MSKFAGDADDFDGEPAAGWGDGSRWERIIVLGDGTPILDSTADSEEWSSEDLAKYLRELAWFEEGGLTDTDQRVLREAADRLSPEDADADADADEEDET